MTERENISEPKYHHEGLLPQHFHLLLVEDNPAHAEQIQHAFQGFVKHDQITTFYSIESTKKWLEKNIPTILISDYHLPDGIGTDLLDTRLENRYPTLIVIEPEDKVFPLQLEPYGAVDYIHKTPDFYHEISHVTRRTLILWEIYSGQVSLHSVISERLRNYRLFFENAPVGIIFFSNEGIITDVNDRLAAILRTTRNSLYGLKLTEIQDKNISKAALKTLNRQSDFFEEEYHPAISKDSPITGLFYPNILTNGTMSGGIGIIEDTNERTKGERLQSTIFNIAEAAGRSRDLNEFFREIHAILNTLLPADNCYIALWDHFTNTISFPFFVDQYDSNPITRKFGNGLTEYMLLSGKPLLINQEGMRQLEIEGKTTSYGSECLDWLGVPLKDTNSNIIGALVIQSYTEGIRFSVNEVEILEYVSTQIAISIQRRRAEEAEQKQRQFAEALLNAVSAVNSTLELTEVCERILLNLQKITSFDQSLIMLIEDDRLRTISHYGTHKDLHDYLKSIIWKDTKSFQTVYQTKQPLVIHDTQEFAGWIDFPGTRWIRSYACFPLLTKGKVIGFLNLNAGHAGYFDESIIPNMMAFADQVTNAIVNARLYSEIQQLAILDDLTGLYNRRGLTIFGKREVERATRFTRSLSVLFIDIDDFKQFNDTYSYAVGDEVLKQVAACIRSHLREIDLVCRYGGDEFVALLPETVEITSKEAAERLRKAIGSLIICARGKQLGITISTGIYSMQPTDTSLDMIIEKAGEILHIAKSRGKNQVSTG